MNGKKFGVFLCGGSVHSSFGAGFLSAIENYKQVDYVDCIIGASAGSFMATYLLAGNAIQRTKGYWEIDVEKHFSYWYNLKKYKTPFFYEFLMRDMFLYDNPIEHWNTVIQHRLNTSGAFKIQVFDAKTGEILYLSCFQNKKVLLESIIASCWLPILAGLRPYILDKDILGGLKITNIDGEEVFREKLKVFDSYVVDRYLIGAMKLYRGKKYLIMNSHKTSKVYGVFGRHLKILEKITSYILFTPYFRAISLYNKNITFGGANQDKKNIYKISQEKNSHIHIFSPPEKTTGWHPDIFRKKAFQGYEAYCKHESLDIIYPEQWGN